MGELRQMDLSGDTKVEWDPNKTEETEAARDTFKKLMDKGYYAYRVTAAGGRGEMIKNFDPHAQKIIMAPRMAGGQ